MSCGERRRGHSCRPRGSRYFQQLLLLLGLLAAVWPGCLAGCLAGCLSSQLATVLSCCPLVGSILGAQRCPHIYETFMPGLVGQPSGTGEAGWIRCPYSLHILLHCPNKKHNKLSTVDRMGHWTEEARRAARGRTLLKFAFDGNPR